MQSISSGERQLMNVLLYATNPVDLFELQLILEKSKRMIYYYISSVDQVLNDHKINPIYNSEAGYYLDDYQKSIVPTILAQSPLMLTPEERVSYLICFIVFNQEKVTLDLLVESFDVSRNAILNDLLEVREVLAKYQLLLNNTKACGYVIEGDIFRKRSVFQTQLKKLLKTLDYKNLNLFDIEKVSSHYKSLKNVLRDLDIEVYQIEIISLAFLLSVMKTSSKLFNYSIIDFSFVTNSKEIDVVDKYFSNLPHHERVYLAIQLISYDSERRKIMIENDLYLLDLASELINTFELLSCLKFNSKEQLVNSVYLHIQLSNYQYYYALPASNPMADEIKRQYSDIYNITKVCCEKLADKFPYPILESEISFFTTHFAAFLKKEERVVAHANVVLVCLNTTTGSLLLKNEIENSFDQVNIVAIAKPSELAQYDDGNIDFIISTIDLEYPLPVLVVNPILSPRDKSKIASHMMSLSMGDAALGSDLKPIYQILRNQITDDDLYHNVVDQIDTYLSKKISYSDESLEIKSSLVSMLKHFGIVVYTGELREDWENTIREGSVIMLQEKAIQMTYVQIMIDLVKKYGSYIVISDEIAIAHAQPEDGVLKLAMSLQIFRNGLKIRDKQVQFLFVLATPNQEDHLGLLNDVIELSNNPKLITDLLSVNSELEAFNILENHFIH